MIGLEYIRKLYGDTTSSLADKLGISNVNISHWETQKKPIPEKRLEELSKIYDIPKKFFSKELTKLEELKIEYKKVSHDYDESVIEYEDAYDFDENGIPREFIKRIDGDRGLLEHLRCLETDIKIEKALQEVRNVIDDSYSESDGVFGIEDFITKREQNIGLIKKFVSLMKSNSNKFLARVLRAVELSNPVNEDWGTNPRTDNELVHSLAEIMRDWNKSEKERREKEYQEYKDLFGIDDTDNNDE